MAGRRLSQFWHPVAVAAEVDEQPQRVTLLGQHVVLFRTAEGVRALRDLCIHRGAALSLGSVRDGRIVCPYHGWEYDGSGACVRIPALPADRPIPPRARAVVHRAEERYGLVWVALEEPVTPIPAMPGDVHEDPAYTGEVSVLDWATSAGRSTENSMDISHFPFVHAGVLGDPDRPEQEPYDLHEDDLGLSFRVENQFWRASDGSWESDIAYDYYQAYPFTMHLRFVEDGERITLVTVAASPTEAKRTRVFRIVHRNHEVDRSQFVREYLHVLEQDRVVVESIRPEEIPADLREELHIRVPDLASIAYRRWLSTVDTMGLAEI